MTEPPSRVCVVTGASSGIGAAFARALAGHGARVWALGRRKPRLLDLAEGGGPGLVRPLVVDLGSVDEVERAAREIVGADESVHLLVHAAGDISLGSVDSLAAVDLDRMYAVNLRAAYVLTRELLPALRRDHGQVVFVNSSAAIRPSSSNALYASSKAGARAFADGLRMEVNPDGVRVLSVYAGRTATPMQEAVHAFEERAYEPDELLDPDDLVAMVLAALDLPARAEVTDLHIRPSRKPSS